MERRRLLAYQVLGSRDVDLLYLPGGVSNVDVMWESARYSRFLDRLASFSRLIVIDRRGTGCSERFSPNAVAPLEVMIDDAITVLDDVRSSGQRSSPSKRRTTSRPCWPLLGPIACRTSSCSIPLRPGRERRDHMGMVPRAVGRSDPDVSFVVGSRRDGRAVARRIGSHQPREGYTSSSDVRDSKFRMDPCVSSARSALKASK